MSDAGPLRIAAECPVCGGPLALRETSNAVRCAHCGADLLVTGRRQLLSWALAPDLPARDAAARVRFALAADLRRARLGEPRLLWVPYLRATAEELCWRRAASPRDRMARILEVASDLRIAPQQLLEGLPGDAAGERDVEAQRIERSLLAVPGLPLAPSLGFRAQSLLLRRFDRAEAASSGVVLPVATPLADARRRLLAPREPTSLVHRELLHATLALVYVPLWAIDLRGERVQRRAFVDAVTGHVATADAAIPLEALAARGGPSAAGAHVLGLRPLACPNCGWALPLRPDDVVFACRGCSRAWLAQAARLFEIGYARVAPPPGARAARFLPVWELTDRRTSRVAHAPAFRCRRLRALVELAARLAARRPALSRADDEAPGDLVGCALDRHDAIRLARFTAAGQGASGAPPPDLRRPHARLLWLPFTHDGYAYCEAHTGASFPTRLLDLAA